MAEKHAIEMNEIKN